MSDYMTPQTDQHPNTTDTEPVGIDTPTSVPMADNAFQVVSDLTLDGQDVENLYYTLLKRAADPASLATDEAELAGGNGPNSGIVTVIVNLGIANALIKSAEYHSLHGHQSNTEFVRGLFEGAFGHAPSAAQLATDVRHLAHHAVSRQALAVSDAESPEAFSHLGLKPV